MIQDLQVQIKQWTTEGSETLLMWDDNSSVSDKDQVLIKFMAATGLTSLLGNPEELPKTYDRGQKCIDFIMGTSKVYAATIRS
jgi:hypothetical protein